MTLPLENLIPWSEKSITEEPLSTASLWSRSSAFLIDALIGLPIGFIIYLMFGANVSDERVIGLIIAAPIFFIKAVRQSVSGQSFGQSALKISVASLQPRNNSEAIMRNLVAFVLMAVPFMNAINAIVIYASKSKQGLHDKVAKTWVINLNTKPESSLEGSLQSSTVGRNLPRTPLIIGAILISLLAIDSGIKTWELSELINKIESSEREMVKVIAANNATRSQYSPNGSRADWDLMETEYAKTAREYAPKVATTGAQVEHLFILPWHLKNLNTQSDFLKHSDAWVQSLNFEAITDDELLWSSELNQNITNTFTVFCATALNAVPTIDFGESAKRIVKICES
jgi:uncharacterized RDD family membrane protein YckC